MHAEADCRRWIFVSQVQLPAPPFTTTKTVRLLFAAARPDKYLMHSFPTLPHHQQQLIVHIHHQYPRFLLRASQPSTANMPRSARPFFLPSKGNFLQNNVVPANDNDAFNDNKCTYCWGAYDDEHPGVRILSCNHVFGRDCLTEMVNAPNGDCCPICHTPLFKPSVAVAIQRFFASVRERLELYMYAADHKLLVIGHKVSEMKNAMPQWLQRLLNWLPFMFRLPVNAQNVYWYADMLITQFTDLRARNPDLNVELAKLDYWCVPIFMWLLLYRGWGAVVAVVWVLLSIVAVVDRLSRKGVHGKLNNRRDRLLFAAIMLVALMVHALVIVSTFLLIVCKSQNTIHPLDALYTGKALSPSW